LIRSLLQKSNEVLQDDIISLREDNTELTKSIDALKEDLKVANKAVDDHLNSSRANEVSSLQEQNAALNNSLGELKEEVASAQKIIALKTQEVEELSSDLKKARFVKARGNFVQPDDIYWKQQLDDERSKIKVLEEEKAKLTELMKRVQTNESVTTTDIDARYEENVKTLTQDLVEAKEKMAAMKSSESQLKTQLAKVFARVNDLLDQIDEKEETISILQETNQQLMSRRTPRAVRSGKMRDPSEIMGEAAVLKETMPSPTNTPRNQNRSSSFYKPPESPTSRARRHRQEKVSFDDHELELD